MRGKGRGEIRKVTEMVADAPTMDSLGRRYEAIDGWGDGSWKSGSIAIILNSPINSFCPLHTALV